MKDTDKLIENTISSNASDAIDRYLLEYTKGIYNLINRYKPKYECKACGCRIPTYPGRYPTKCPACSHVRLERVKWEQRD